MKKRHPRTAAAGLIAVLLTASTAAQTPTGDPQRDGCISGRLGLG